MSTFNIADLLKQNLQKRSAYLHKNKLEAFRLYDRDNFELPLAIDIYRDNAVIHVFGRTEASTLQALEEALKQVLKITAFFYKNRTKGDLHLPHQPSARREGEQAKNLAVPVLSTVSVQIKEYGHKFWCNLSDYLDTGLFLDHRETRKWIAEQSHGKTVLNTFAYTGSFSVYAAAGKNTPGAAKTYSVDLSKTYCEWIKKNLELNGLPQDRNWVYKMDTLEFFKYAKKKNLTFDIIIIDPPSFSRNKGSSFSVQKDHPALINAALELLNPKGFILFSNNKQDFRLNEEKLAPCTIQDIQKQTIPPDFTNPNAHHCFVIRADERST